MFKLLDKKLVIFNIVLFLITPLFAIAFVFSTFTIMSEMTSTQKTLGFLIILCYSLIAVIGNYLYLKKKSDVVERVFLSIIYGLITCISSLVFFWIVVVAVRIG